MYQDLGMSNGETIELSHSPRLFSTENLNISEISQVVDGSPPFWHLERTVLRVPCQCRPSSLAHLDEFHTSFKLHGLEMRTGSFSGKGGWNPVIYEQNFRFVMEMETHENLLYFLEMPNQKEKVNIKWDDHLIGKWPCYPDSWSISKNCRNSSSNSGKDVLWDLGCGDGVVLIEVCGLRLSSAEFFCDFSACDFCLFWKANIE